MLDPVVEDPLLPLAASPSCRKRINPRGVTKQEVRQRVFELAAVVQQEEEEGGRS